MLLPRKHQPFLQQNVIKIDFVMEYHSLDLSMLADSHSRNLGYLDCLCPFQLSIEVSITSATKPSFNLAILMPTNALCELLLEHLRCH